MFRRNRHEEAPVTPPQEGQPDVVSSVGDLSGQTPRELLEQFVQGQIDARSAQIARTHTEEASLQARLAQIEAEREAFTAQMDDWARWLGLLR